jgi:subtilisin-like proprotein convertase family protein
MIFGLRDRHFFLLTAYSFHEWTFTLQVAKYCLLTTTCEHFVHAHVPSIYIDSSDEILVSSSVTQIISIKTGWNFKTTKPTAI